MFYHERLANESYLTTGKGSLTDKLAQNIGMLKVSAESKSALPTRQEPFVVKAN